MIELCNLAELCNTAPSAQSFIPQELCTDASQRWSLTKIAVAHKIGPCPVGDTSVVIAASSTHRRDALEVRKT